MSLYLFRKTVFQWLARFCEGHVKVKDEHKCGKPVTSRIVIEINNYVYMIGILQSEL